MHDIQQIIKHLEDEFTLYAAYWAEWTEEKQNSLTETEQYIIWVFIQNKFKIESDELIMFYNRQEVIVGLIEKLKSDFDAFQNWAITKYQFSLIKLAKQNHWDIFWQTPIWELPLPKELKANLQFYKLNTLNEVFEKYSEEDFKEINTFKNIVGFQKIIMKTNLIKQQHEQLRKTA